MDFHDSVTVFVELTKFKGSFIQPLCYIYIFFSPRTSIINDNMHCKSLCCSKWVIVTVGCLCVLCPVSLCVYLTATALFSRPLAPGLYLLLSLTVMKPAFKERGAGSEASQIRPVEWLAG